MAQLETLQYETKLVRVHPLALLSFFVGLVAPGGLYCIAWMTRAWRFGDITVLTVAGAPLIISVAAGTIASRQVFKHPQRWSGEGFAIAGFFFCVVWDILLLGISLVFPGF